MVRKRLDDRVRRLLESGIATGQRSMLVLVGDYGKDQVPHLHSILTKSNLSNTLTRPNVLWCYKKDLGFSTHKKKRMKKLKRDKARGLTNETEDAFDLFCGQTDITWCYYKDSHRVLGTTNGVLVLQDFEALTPNILARTIETVQGGGLVIFLLRTVKSLKQLYTMSMDVHKRYRTEGSGDIVPRFNERFLLSLGRCRNCLVCDDELNILPLSRKALESLNNNEPIQATQVPEDEELKRIQESLTDTPHIGVLAGQCRTLDQCRAVLEFLEAASDKDTNSSKVVCMTAARGRGKSAGLGLSLAGALALGYSNIVVTAPAPENLVAVFGFILQGLKALEYQEHLDYSVQYNTSTGRENTKCIIAVHLNKTHRQSIRYAPPEDASAMATSEIVAIDEAAAIPLPLVRRILKSGKSLYFLSSTVNGYEGTGRALSLKLMSELRQRIGSRASQIQKAREASASVTGSTTKKGEFKVHEQRWAAASQAASEISQADSALREVALSTPIRYRSGDAIEAWLNKLLCLDCLSDVDMNLKGGAPSPGDCELYHVDRDALFSYHSLSESFLQKIMGLYTSAHYKNTPNDLQLLSDAPSHHVYCLLSPSAEEDSNSLPDVLCVVQVALEGKISRKAVNAQLARGHRSAGDLIPWTLSQQFSDASFAKLSGARIVRIAVHPSVQNMGYGSRAIELLYRFYNGEIVSLSMDEAESAHEDTDHDDESEDNEPGTQGTSGLQMERLKPRKELPPLLLPLTEVDAPVLDWIGSSFGLTLGLEKFWGRAGMKLLYLRQTKNELTGEHSSIMVRALPRTTGVDDVWLSEFVTDARRRVVSLLAGPFREMDVRLALAVLENMVVASNPESKSLTNAVDTGTTSMKADEMEIYLSPHDMKRVETYGRNLCDHHLVADLLPTLARLYFMGKLGTDFTVSNVQAAVICGMGLQHKSVDILQSELSIPSQQVLAMFNKAIRKISIALNAIAEDRAKEEILGVGDKKSAMLKAVEKMKNVTEKTLDEDVEASAHAAMAQLETANARLPAELAKDGEIMQFAVKGTDEQWEKALGNDGTRSMVQISQVREKRKKTEDALKDELEAASKKTKKNKKHSKKQRR